MLNTKSQTDYESKDLKMIIISKSNTTRGRWSDIDFREFYVLSSPQYPCLYQFHKYWIISNSTLLQKLQELRNLRQGKKAILQMSGFLPTSDDQRFGLVFHVRRGSSQFGPNLLPLVAVNLHIISQETDVFSGPTASVIVRVESPLAEILNRLDGSLRKGFGDFAPETRSVLASFWVVRIKIFPRNLIESVYYGNVSK